MTIQLLSLGHGAGALCSDSPALSLMDAIFVGRQCIREHRRARADCRHLSVINASTLKDIGIDRRDIISLTLGGRSGRRR